MAICDVFCHYVMPHYLIPLLTTKLVFYLRAFLFSFSTFSIYIPPLSTSVILVTSWQPICLCIPVNTAFLVAVFSLSVLGDR